SGAVILVSHDMHLLGLVADRLWLVQNGRVTPYEEDLEAYRKMLLAPREEGGAPSKGKIRSKPVVDAKPKLSRDDLMTLRSELRKSEARVAKIEEMRDKLAAKLASPDMYEAANSGQLSIYNRKYAEIMEGLERAEAMWLAAQVKLDAATGRG
ncbi:MAG: ATP-binding cassette subfamily F protein 3, partial [Dinoroseobacter sp.]